MSALSPKKAQARHRKYNPLGAKLTKGAPGAKQLYGPPPQQAIVPPQPIVAPPPDMVEGAPAQQPIYPYGPKLP
jgi:hypothetical protein